MEMPHYKLTYFDLRARGEAIRLVFALKKVPYEDLRLDFGDMKEWLKIKHGGKFPFEQLPILEVDGVILGQSMAILRYVAKEHGLSPVDNLQVAKADMIVDDVYDIENRFVKILVGEKGNPEKQKALFDEYYKEFLPKHCGYLEKLLAANDGGKGYFVGDKISYADLDFFSVFNGYIGGGKLEVPDALKGFPLLTDLYQRVMNEPNIVEWIKKRPITTI